jgi:outer membrane protein OmpA-like peptidoglycan-associated protein
MAFDRAVSTRARQSNTTVAVPVLAATTAVRPVSQPAVPLDFSQVRVHSGPRVVRRLCGPAAIGTIPGCDNRSGAVVGPSFLFKVGCDEFAPGEAAKLRAFAMGVAPGEQVTVDGFASDEGATDFNLNLSCARAHVAVAVLTSAGVSPAQIDRRYMHGATPGPRPGRRSVVVTKRSAPVSPPAAPAPPAPAPPVPAPPAPAPPVPSSDCTPSQDADIRRVRPMAVRMVDKSIRMLTVAFNAPERPRVDAMARKYFGDDSVPTLRKVLAGFREIKDGLATGVTYECENRGSFMYGHFCDGVLAYVRRFLGRDVHLCDNAFGRGDQDLATTIVHENSHRWDGTADEQYCDQFSGCTLSPDDAIDNADSFAQFAEEINRTFP